MKDKTPQSIKPSEVNLDVLDDSVGYFLRVLAKSFSGMVDDRLSHAPYLKGRGRITTLLIVDSHPGIRPSVIATLLMNDRSAMGRLIDALVRAGLIERQDAPDDNRAQGLFITEKGRKMAEEIRPLLTGASRDFFSDLTEEEHDLLLSLLRRSYKRIVGLPETDGST